jgi:hypothetical protein
MRKNIKIIISTEKKRTKHREHSYGSVIIQKNTQRKVELVSVASHNNHAINCLDAVTYSSSRYLAQRQQNTCRERHDGIVIPNIIINNGLSPPRWGRGANYISMFSDQQTAGFLTAGGSALITSVTP